MSSQYGSVKTFHPQKTTRDPADPEKKLRYVSARWGYRFYFRGVLHQKAGFKSSTEARKAGERRKAEIASGLEDDPREFSILGLYELHAARKVQWDDSTQKAFEFTWKRLRKKLPDSMRVEQLTATRLLQLAGEWKAEGYAQHTIKTNFKRLREALTLAHSERRVTWIPALPKIKTPHRDQVIHPVQLAQIREHMPERFHLVLEAAEETGWRARSELLSRKWCHVDWERGLELDAMSSKTDAGRVFPMTIRLRDILTRARARVEAIQRASGKVGEWVEWVFPADDGTQLHEYQKHWEAALAKLGIGKIPGRKGPWSSLWVMHDARRSKARELQRQGIEGDVRKALLGHTTDSAHDVYLPKGMDSERLKATAERLDRIAGMETKVEAIRKPVSG